MADNLIKDAADRTVFADYNENNTMNIRPTCISRPVKIALINV